MPIRPADPTPSPAPAPAAATPAADAPTDLLAIDDLVVEFDGRGSLFRRGTPIRAVDGVSLRLARGQTLGLVGESGSGKSTVGRAIVRLVPARGSVRFDGLDVLAARGRDLRRLRRRVQLIFQDPSGSLSPRLRVRDIIAEPMVVHGSTRAQRRERVAELLGLCGLPPDAGERYPAEFSGGQRQRIGIARALALHPDLLICDEPTSALDVSVQAQILNLLRELQDRLGLSILLISHDMAVVQHMCPRIAVMHRGRIVETGPRERVLASPEHEYTRRLLDAVPAVPL